MFRNPDFLRIAAIKIGTYALGPGYRAAIWVQGCPLHCRGCIAPEWTLPGGTLVPVREIAKLILSDPSIQGLTISGGEPMMQAEALNELVSIVHKNKKDVNVICFSGFTYDFLKKKTEKGIHDFLNQIDLLIDGPYIEEFNNGLGLRGSTNQRMIHITNRLSDISLEDNPRKIEIDMSDGEAFIIGVPPKSFGTAWQNAMESIRQEINP
jgi:anaerobic ribonucleoside-triphosphate reductase activating protein